MQTACEQKLFSAQGKSSKSGRMADACPHSAVGLRMDPAEVKLSVQLFAGGLVVSGLMLLVIYALGL